LLEGIGTGMESDETQAIQALFPTKDKFRMLQMISDLSPRSVGLISVLGVIRRRFNSQVLLMYEEELRMNKIAQDRKGRIELSEVIVGARRAGERDQLP
jgi:hypothetical protein